MPRHLGRLFNVLKSRKRLHGVLAVPLKVSTFADGFRQTTPESYHSMEEEEPSCVDCVFYDNPQFCDYCNLNPENQPRITHSNN